MRRGPLAAAAAAALLAQALLGVTASATASTTASIAPAAAAGAAADSSAVSLTVAPAQSALVHTGEDLHLSVSVNNDAVRTHAGSRIAVGVSDDTLDDSAELSAWLAGGDELAPSGAEGTGMPENARLVGTADAPSVVGDSSAVIPMTIPAAALDMGERAWGAQGLVATLIAADGSVVASSRSTAVLVTGAMPQSTVTVVLPITTPQSAAGLIPADLLGVYTSSTGMLTRALEAAQGRTVAVALDPRILVSIRVLGTSAPASALAWLDRLATLDNEVFALPYADADIVAQAQSGIETFLQPVSFDYAVDPADFAPAEPSPTPTNAPSDGMPAQSTAPDTESSADDAAAPALPTLDSLLEWPYSVSGLAWPAPDTVNPGTLPVLAANGYDTVIVSSDNLAGGAGTAPVSARAGESPVLVADSILASALRDAVVAERDTTMRAAIATATAVISTAANSDTPRSVLATLPRDWPTNPSALNTVLTALGQLPFAAASTLDAVAAEAPAAVSLAELSEAPERLASVTALHERETALTGFSTAVADPSTVLGPERATLLALLGVGWLSDGDAWRAAVGTDLVRTSTVLNSVSIAPNNSVLVVGGSAQFPVTVQNAFTEPVAVRVNLLPSNGRLVVDDSVEATVEAGASTTVLVPVNAQVGNGPVNVQVTLTSAAGVQLGAAATIPVNVQADWEGVGAAVLGGAVVLFFGFGLVRNIRRRRREGAEAGSGDREDGEAPAGEKPVGVVSSTDASPTATEPEHAAEPENATEPEQPRG